MEKWYNFLEVSQVNYPVVFEPNEEGGWTVSCPVLPGCISEGETKQEALRNIKEALELWLEVKKEAGEAIPTDDPQRIRNASLTIGVLV